jgi:hypothetical protein
MKKTADGEQNELIRALTATLAIGKYSSRYEETAISAALCPPRVYLENCSS